MRMIWLRLAGLSFILLSFEFLEEFSAIHWDFHEIIDVRREEEATDNKIESVEEVKYADAAQMNLNFGMGEKGLLKWIFDNFYLDSSHEKGSKMFQNQCTHIHIFTQSWPYLKGHRGLSLIGRASSMKAGWCHPRIVITTLIRPRWSRPSSLSGQTFNGEDVHFE